MPHASCLAPLGVVAACSSCAGLFWSYSYFTVSACLLFWTLQPLVYSAYFAVPTGIACLTFLTCDLSSRHDGIVCLASLACDGETAC